MKYLVAYKDLSKKEKENIDEEKLVVVKKYREGEFNFFPLKLFSEDRKYILENYETIGKNSAVFIALKIKENEIDKYLFRVRKFELIEDNTYEEVKDKYLSLINYNMFGMLSLKELNDGRIVILNKDKKYYTIDLEENFISKRNINETRLNLKQKDVFCDMYFYTLNKSILNKYKDDITRLEVIDEYTYAIDNGKLFIIDSIDSSRIYDISNSSYGILRDLTMNSVPVFYDVDTNEVRLYRKSDYDKKGYLIVKSNFKSLFYSNSIEPLMKYINLFEVDGGDYKKIGLEEYLKDKNILKYIKKPNN